MHGSVRLVLLGAAAAALLHGRASAAETEPEADPSVTDLMKRIERLEKDNVELKDEVARLQAETSDGWLTEQRAEEIKALVTDVLADADQRSSLQADGLTAGWSEHFFLASTDGRFKLELDGLIQFRFLWNYHNFTPNKYVWGFELARTRLTFRGHVFDRDLTYLVRLDVNRNEPSVPDTGLWFLTDAWIRYNLNEEFSVRAGQFKLPFNREELVGPGEQLAIERSLVNENTNLGRSQGIELLWHGTTGRFSFAYSDSATDNLGFNFNLLGTPKVNPLNSPWSNLGMAEYAFTGRYEQLFAGNWDQFRDMTSPPGEEFGLLVGVAMHYQRQRTEAFAGHTPIWFAATADISADWGGANIFSSFTYEYMETRFSAFPIANVFGFVLQGGTYFTEKLEGYARFEYGHFDLSNVDLEDLILLTLGVNYYFQGEDVKLSADVGFGINRVDSPWISDIAGWRTDPPGSQPQIVIRTQLQLMF